MVVQIWYNIILSVHCLCCQSNSSVFVAHFHKSSICFSIPPKMLKKRNFTILLIQHNEHETCFTYTMYSLGWHTVDATPPIVHQGFTTVCPPVTVVPASRAESLNSKDIGYLTYTIKNILWNKLFTIKFALLLVST